MAKKFGTGNNVVINEPCGLYNGLGRVLDLSPSTMFRRGRALNGTLQWRYKVATNKGHVFIDENYLTKRK